MDGDETPALEVPPALQILANSYELSYVQVCLSISTLYAIRVLDAEPNSEARAVLHNASAQWEERAWEVLQQPEEKKG